MLLGIQWAGPKGAVTVSRAEDRSREIPGPSRSEVLMQHNPV